MNDLEEKFIQVTAPIVRKEQEKMRKISDMRDRAESVLTLINRRYTESEVGRDMNLNATKLLAEFIVMYTEDRL